MLKTDLSPTGSSTITHIHTDTHRSRSFHKPSSRGRSAVRLSILAFHLYPNPDKRLEIMVDDATLSSFGDDHSYALAKTSDRKASCRLVSPLSNATRSRIMSSGEGNNLRSDEDEESLRRSGYDCVELSADPTTAAVITQEVRHETLTTKLYQHVQNDRLFDYWS